MQKRHIALALLITIVWGFNFVPAKLAVQSFPPFLTNSLRFLAVGLLLSPFLKIVQGRMKLLLLIGFTLGVLHFSFMFIALATGVSVSSMAVATQLSVPFSTLLAIFLLKESVGWRRWLAIVVSFSGVGVMTLEPSVFQYLDAVFWISLSALCYSLSTVAMRYMRDVPAMTVQAWVGVVGGVGSLAASAIFESGQLAAMAQADVMPWLAIGYSVVFSSILGHGGINFLLTRYDVAMVSPYSLLMPFFAIVAGVLAFGEALSARIIGGALLTMLGVAIVTTRTLKKNENQSRNEALEPHDP